MKNVRVARRYAVALLADAEQKNMIEAVAADLGTLGRLMHDSRELRHLVASRLVSAEKKLRIIDELFTSRFCTETLDFLHLLIDKQREALLPDIISQYAVVLNEKRGIVTVDVTLAVEIAPLQEKALHERLEHYTQKKVKVRFSLDAGIKGGVVVRIGDTVLDASIKHQLELLRESLVGGTAS
jgi:F-type H+-transporting ATPase subunit delta